MTNPLFRQSCKFFILIVLIGTMSCNQETDETLTLKDCTVHYKKYKGGGKEAEGGHYYISNAMELEVAQREFGLCLCESYLRTKDVEIGERLLNLYDEHYFYFPDPKSITIRNLDSIVKNREAVFGPRLVFD